MNYIDFKIYTPDARDRYRGRGGPNVRSNIETRKLEDDVNRMRIHDRRGRGGHRGHNTDRGRGRGRGGKRTEKFGDKFDTDRTRPQNLETKIGTSGQEIQLTANYFELEQRPDTKLFQYRVDFSLEEDRTFMKKALLRQHKDELPQYMFDGSIMLSFERLYDEGMGPLTFLSSRVNGDGSQAGIYIMQIISGVGGFDYRFGKNKNEDSMGIM